MSQSERSQTALEERGAAANVVVDPRDDFNPETSVSVRRGRATW